MSEKIQVNITKFLMKCIAGTSKSHKYIDDIFYANQEEYSKCIQENKKIWSKEYDIDSFLIKEKSYFYKLLAIFKDMLNEAQNTGEYTTSSDVLIYILDKTYPDAFKYAVSTNVLKLSSLSKKLHKKNEKMCDNELFGKFLTAMLISNNVDMQDSFYIHFMNMIYALELKNHKDMLKTQCLYDNESKDKQKLINKIELVIRSRFYKNGYSIDDVTYEPFKHGVQNEYNQVEHFEKIKNKTTAKQMLAMEFALNMTEYPKILEMLGYSFEAKVKDIKNYINSYLTVAKWSNEEDVNYDELHEFINLMIINLAYLEAYKMADDFFFDNYNDKTNIELIRSNNELRECKKKNLKLQNENMSLQNEVTALQKELELLKKDISDNDYNKKELVELRNYIFNQDLDNDSEENYNTIDIDKINEVSAICIGGNKAWVDKMKAILPNWSFIQEDMMNFDASIIKNYKYVFIKAIHISHALYYRVIANITDNQELRYINSNNTERVLSDINKAI